jgi:hypothetical protein
MQSENHSRTVYIKILNYLKKIISASLLHTLAKNYTSPYRFTHFTPGHHRRTEEPQVKNMQFV